jgi:hypothetical protein
MSGPASGVELLQRRRGPGSPWGSPRTRAAGLSASPAVGSSRGQTRGPDRRWISASPAVAGVGERIELIAATPSHGGSGRPTHGQPVADGNLLPGGARLVLGCVLDEPALDGGGLVPHEPARLDVVGSKSAVAPVGQECLVDAQMSSQLGWCPQARAGLGQPGVAAGGAGLVANAATTNSAVGGHAYAIGAPRLSPITTPHLQRSRCSSGLGGSRDPLGAGPAALLAPLLLGLGQSTAQDVHVTRQELRIGVQRQGRARVT